MKKIKLGDAVPFQIKQNNNKETFKQLENIEMDSRIAQYNLLSIEEIHNHLEKDKKQLPQDKSISNYINNLILSNYVSMVNLFIEVNILAYAPLLHKNPILKTKIKSHKLIVENDYIFNDRLKINFHDKDINYRVIFNAGLFSMALLLLDIPTNQNQDKSYYDFNNPTFFNANVFNVIDMIKLFFIEFLKHENVFFEGLLIHFNVNEYGHIGAIYLNHEHAVVWNNSLFPEDKLYSLLQKANQLKA